MQETLGMLRQGGWIVGVLGLCSLAAVTIIIERAAALRRGRILDERIASMLRMYRGEIDAEAALAKCRSSVSPLARLAEGILRARNLGHAHLQEAMHATGRTQIASMERGLTALEIIGVTSPLLGLLGTVLGMVDVFNAITSEGLGDPHVLSGGISKALVTTVVGLCVAIPAVAFYTLFTKRVEDYAAEMHDLGATFIARIETEKQQPGHTEI